jgi:hypothetical protein
VDGLISLEIKSDLSDKILEKQEALAIKKIKENFHYNELFRNDAIYYYRIQKSKMVT